MKYYYYLYYRVYKALSKIGKFQLPIITKHNISLMEMYFIYGIILIVYEVFKLPKLIIYITGIFIFLVVIFNDIVFLRKDKYKQILLMFENETKQQKRISSIIVISIYILTFILFSCSLIITYYSSTIHIPLF